MMKHLMTICTMILGMSLTVSGQSNKDISSKILEPMTIQVPQPHLSPSSLINNWNKFKPKEPTAFFCRMERKWEKASGHPIRFRLGDIRQVDYYEGKITLDQTDLRPQ